MGTTRVADAGLGGLPSAMTRNSTGSIGSRFICPIVGPTETTWAVASIPSPGGAVSAEVMLAICAFAAFIRLMPARAWVPGSQFLSISLACFLSLLTSLKNPISASRVERVEPLAHRRVRLHPRVPAVHGGLPVLRRNAPSRGQRRCLALVVVHRGQALGDLRVELQADASDRLEVGTNGGRRRLDCLLGRCLLRSRHGLCVRGHLLSLLDHLRGCSHRSLHVLYLLEES